MVSDPKNKGTLFSWRCGKPLTSLKTLYLLLMMPERKNEDTYYELFVILWLVRGFPLSSWNEEITIYYLTWINTNYENKCTFNSPSFKVAENKSPLFFDQISFEGDMNLLSFCDQVRVLSVYSWKDKIAITRQYKRWSWK